MQIPEEIRIKSCIAVIERQIKIGAIKDRASAIAYACGYLHDYGVVPIDVIEKINMQYYLGNISC